MSNTIHLIGNVASVITRNDYTRPDGLAPLIGDADDGRFLPLGDYLSADPRSHLHLFSQAILRHFPEGTRLSRPEGGFVLWVEMPARVDTLKLQREALKQHINTAPGALFSVKDRYRNCLRMNCGVPWGETIENAVRTLGDLAKKQL